MLRTLNTGAMVIWQDGHQPHPNVEHPMMQSYRRTNTVLDGLVKWVDNPSPVLVDRGIRTNGFELLSGLTNDVQIDMCRFLAKRSTLFG